MQHVLKRLGLFLIVAGMYCNHAAYAADSVPVENAKVGTADWQIPDASRVACVGPPSCPHADIEGYASLTSVNQGGQINFFVSTASTTTYTMKVFRIGWYGGAGGRLMGALKSDGSLQLPQSDGTIPPNLLPQLPGSTQSVPLPGDNGLIECNWPAASTNPLSIPSNWTSGIYLAKLQEATAGKQNYIIFVVRDDSRSSPYLYNSSVNTYQAYNNWGPDLRATGGSEGYSLYTTDSSGNPTAHKVSFKRPYHSRTNAGDFFPFEINMVRWLEKQGYDTTYVTDVDLHENPDLAISHQALLIAGHSEYWSWKMRANVERARERGVSLAFFSGNSVFWQVRFEPGSNGDADRTLVGFKGDALQDPYYTDPDLSKHRYTTTTWSSVDGTQILSGAGASDPVNRPDESLVGVGYSPLSCNASEVFFGDITTTDPSTWPSWLSQSTGLSTNSHLSNMLGYEVDVMHGYQPVGTISIASSTLFATDTSGCDPSVGQNTQTPSNMILYTAPSGAEVLSSGSVFWDKGLDNYGMNPGDMNFDPWTSKGVVPAAQQMTANFLNQALQITPVPASARLAATISASSSAAGYPAANAGDGKASTQWVASLTPDLSNNNAWIQLDFGTQRWIQRIKWQGANGLPYPASSPAEYYIQVSDDGTSWRTVGTRTNTPVSQINADAIVNGNEPVNQQGRYLRLVATKVNDGTGWSLSVFEFWAEGAAPPPSARLKAINATGSSQASGYPAANAVDGSNTTQWVANLTPTGANNSAWFQLDFGSRKQIDRVKWVGANGTPYPASSPSEYSFQVSDDGTNWVTVGTRTNTPVSQINAYAIVNGDEPVNAQGRYLRIVTTKVNDGTGWSLSFFEFWGEGSDCDNVLGATATASSEASGYPAANAVDGSNTTQWVANLTPTGANNSAWFQLDFGSRKQIDCVKWLGANGVPYPAASPSEYSFQVSDDGTNWVTVGTRTNTPLPQINPYEIVNGDELINAQGRYLRIVTTKVNDGTGWALSFFEFWAEGY
jgi:F5/8 type C domain